MTGHLDQDLDTDQSKRPMLTKIKKIKKLEKAWEGSQTISQKKFYGIDLLYSFPSRASLYISATYGFFAGVSAPISTRRAYTLTT